MRHWADQADRLPEMPSGGRYGGAERGWAAGLPHPSGMGIGGVPSSYEDGARPKSYRGRGPRGYARSDDRLRELVCEALTEDDRVDATNVEVTVTNGEVTLAGEVEDRQMKRWAEECVDQIAGVRDVQNRLRVPHGGIDQ